MLFYAEEEVVNAVCLHPFFDHLKTQQSSLVLIVDFSQKITAFLGSSLILANQTTFEGIKHEVDILFLIQAKEPPDDKLPLRR